jgi:hypothetical protein
MTISLRTGALTVMLIGELISVQDQQQLRDERRSSAGFMRFGSEEQLLNIASGQRTLQVGTGPDWLGDTTPVLAA